MISKGGELSETRVDVANTRYKKDDNNRVGTLKPICGKMIMGKELFTPIKKAQIGDKLQACVLYDIIETRLSLNYFQRIVVEKIFHYAITVRGNQCSDRN